MQLLFRCEFLKMVFVVKLARQSRVFKTASGAGIGPCSLYYISVTI